MGREICGGIDRYFGALLVRVQRGFGGAIVSRDLPLSPLPRKEVNMKSLILLLAVTPILLAGCGYANSYYLTYNFEKDKVMVATVGSEMMNWTEIYKNDVYGNIIGSFVMTLTYSGKQGNILKIYYREESNNYARPSFTQELTYDITDDPIITFRHTKIRIMEATNSEIKFTVLECPAFAHPSGEKEQR